MTKTTIKAIQSNGTWEGKYGVMYQFEVELEDSTVGEVNAKTETPPYAVGSTVWYEIKGETKYGKKLKITTSDPDQQSGGFKAPAPQGSDTQKRIENSWAVGIAVQICGPLSTANVSLEEYLKIIDDLAPRMLDMRDNVSKPKAAATNPVQRQTEPRGDMAQQFNESQGNPAEDGLPF
jgi:hypothetical protein